MRIVIVSLVAWFVLACGSSAKKRDTLRADGSSDRGPAPSLQQDTNKGDVTLSTNTGDDLSWLAPVYFELDSAALLPATRETLGRLHDWLVAHPDTTITIEGHCDEQGTTEYNIGLGQRRAQALVDYVVRLGTDARRLKAVSYGSERPAADGHDEIAWSKNRRGEFRVAR